MFNVSKIKQSLASTASFVVDIARDVPYNVATGALMTIAAATAVLVAPAVAAYEVAKQRGAH